MTTRRSSPAAPASSARTSATACSPRAPRRLRRQPDHRQAATTSPTSTGGADFRFIQHDVTRPIEIDGPVDNVLHFASPASPIDYLELPIQTLKVGSLGTHNALGLAKAKGARFLLASTSEVYGDPLVHPQPESYWGNVNPIGPRGVYDEAKRFAEAMTMAYHRVPRRRHAHRAHLQHLRPAHAPATTAAWCRPSSSRRCAASRSPSSATAARRARFCYVDDLVEGIYRLLTSRRARAGQHRQPARDDDPQFAERILRAHRLAASPIEFKPLPVDDPKTRQPDITRRARDPRLGAAGAARRRPRQDHRLLPLAARRDRAAPSPCGPESRRERHRGLRPLRPQGRSGSRDAALRRRARRARSPRASARDCWAEWQRAEVMVINELRLNFMDPAAQETLTRQLREFLLFDPPPET